VLTIEVRSGKGDSLNSGITNKSHSDNI
jgi:hypothetical protein